MIFLQKTKHHLYFKSLKMKTLNFNLVFVAIVFFILSSCSQVSQSGDVGDDFYSYLQQENYEAIIRLLDEDALKKYSADEWKKLFMNRNEYYGKLNSYKPVGFHTETQQDIKIIKLDYLVKNVNGSVNEQIELIHRGNKLKILNYSFPVDVAMAK